MRDITQINLDELVPDSIRGDERVSAAIQAINGELQAVSQLAMVPALVSRIDELTSTQLDHMAWQYDSKIWRDTWPINLKRSVIKSVILEKSKKGTRRAVSDALNAMGSSVVLREWWEESPAGTPHTFSIVATVNDVPGQTSAQTQKDLFIRLDDVKPVRSHYDFTFAIQSEGNIAPVATVRPVAYARIHGHEA